MVETTKENEKKGDNEVLRFFIEIVKKADEGTPKKIESKLKDKRQQTNFICYSLTDEKNVIELL